MSTDARQILESALALPPNERAVIAEELLASLEPPDPAIEALWIKEVKSRLAAYDAGLIEAIDSEEFFAEEDES